MLNDNMFEEWHLGAIDVEQKGKKKRQKTIFPKAYYLLL